MTPVTSAQLGLAVIGLAVWGYGTRLADPRVSWTGVAILVVASLLRFVKRRTPPGD